MTDDTCGRTLPDFFAIEGSTVDCQRPARHEGMCWQQPFYSDSNHRWPGGPRDTPVPARRLDRKETGDD